MLKTRVLGDSGVVNVFVRVTENTFGLETLAVLNNFFRTSGILNTSAPGWWICNSITTTARWYAVVWDRLSKDSDPNQISYSFYFYYMEIPTDKQNRTRNQSERPRKTKFSNKKQSSSSNLKLHFQNLHFTWTFPAATPKIFNFQLTSRSGGNCHDEIQSHLHWKNRGKVSSVRNQKEKSTESFIISKF